MDRKPDTKKETRRAGRKASARTAIVVYGEKRAVMSATILDIAAGGARIKTPARATLPDTFFVIDLATETAYLCAVMHHTGDICGVKFMNRHPLTSVPPSLEFLRNIRTRFAPR